jgi:uncharacterized membrane protein
MKNLVRHRRINWIALLLIVALVTWVLNASTAGSRATGCPQGCASQHVRSGSLLKVISFECFARLSSLSQPGRVELDL